jgi:hypothetical protein
MSGKDLKDDECSTKLSETIPYSKREIGCYLYKVCVCNSPTHMVNTLQMQVADIQGLNKLSVQYMQYVC